MLCFLPFFLSADVESLIPVQVAKIPHDLPAFTQGLAIEGGHFFESTGHYGKSSLRQIDLSTGKVKRNADLPDGDFAEGLAVFPSFIVQLTWRENKSIVYDRQTFKLVKTYPYSGEGWGLCRDGKTLWMSNGTHRLVQRDAETFEMIKSLEIYNQERPISGLNDLECVGPNLYANVFGTSSIIRIDKKSGLVTAIIDASNLLSPQEKKALNSSEVLNGIAYREETDTFFLTGKEWPWIFEVRLTQK